MDKHYNIFGQKITTEERKSNILIRITVLRHSKGASFTAKWKNNIFTMQNVTSKFHLPISFRFVLSPLTNNHQK